MPSFVRRARNRQFAVDFSATMIHTANLSTSRENTCLFTTSSYVLLRFSRKSLDGCNVNLFNARSLGDTFSILRDPSFSTIILWSRFAAGAQHGRTLTCSLQYGGCKESRHRLMHFCPTRFSSPVLPPSSRMETDLARACQLSTTHLPPGFFRTCTSAVQCSSILCTL